MIDKGIPRHGYPVFVGEDQIGCCDNRYAISHTKEEYRFSIS